MKRFYVTKPDGRVLRLYYLTMDVAQTSNPDSLVEECEDLGYTEYIARMLTSADECKIGRRRGSEVYLLRFSTFAGPCFAVLLKDERDGIWYDHCEYQLHKTGSLVMPVGRTLSDPESFCRKFLIPKSEYNVLSMDADMVKPEELRGIKKFASVPFAGMRQCQLFLNGEDLYIRHECYFPNYVHLKDEIDPWTHLPKTVFVAHNAWLQIKNFIPLVKILNGPEVACAVWPMIREYNHWNASERNPEWDRFLEDVANATKKYLVEVSKTKVSSNY